MSLSGHNNSPQLKQTSQARHNTQSACSCVHGLVLANLESPLVLFAFIHRSPLKCQAFVEL